MQERMEFMMFCRGKIRFLVEKERLQEDSLQEIRLRTGQPLILIYRDREVFPMQDGKPYRGAGGGSERDAGICQQLFALCV